MHTQSICPSRSESVSETQGIINTDLGTNKSMKQTNSSTAATESLLSHKLSGWLNFTFSHTHIHFTIYTQSEQKPMYN